MFVNLRAEATIGSSTEFQGIGVHNGKAVTMKALPSQEGFGIVFKRTDIFGKNPFIKLSPEAVVDPTLCTRVVNNDGVQVTVVEHLLAALRICGITNALIELDSSEAPIMDGSAAVFVKEFKKAGIIRQDSFVPAGVIKRPIVVKSKNGGISLTPNEHCKISVKVSYDKINPVVGIHNQHSFVLEDGESSLNDIADSRTFGWVEDYEKIKSMGMALGASEENTIAIKDDSLINLNGLRNPKELVMHKCLDLIGDISVLGYDIIGKIECLNPSHSLNNNMIRTLAKELYRHKIVTTGNTENLNGRLKFA
ncbi:MAG: UDP-3-O-acyl-N-acetylglucosamine deacetylase [Holosporales bacterium]|jgi:UDP-3-O-[3-hydroxymyristoyl] N-acetylglucosamine deacetylase|nr:UDP-3-O-acyl-N-acetylglucosamine deacetylase [Holosporales bacterium]